MDFYISQNGEPRGPFRVFQIKEMLDSGEAQPRDLGWHTGLEQWRPLEEIDALASFVPRETPPSLPEMDEEEMEPLAETGQTPSSVENATRVLPQATEPELSRWELFYRRALPRFLARCFDTSLFYSLTVGVGVALKLLPANALVFPPFWFVPAQALGWVIVEAWLLSRFATTPGKWIFNITVQHPVEGVPAFGRALRRTFFIWVCAWGVGFPGWAFFGASVALLLYLQNGRMVWDYLVNTEVVHGEARPLRWIMWVAYFVCYWTACLTLVITQPLPTWVNEEQRQQIEQMKEQLRQASQPPTRK